MLTESFIASTRSVERKAQATTAKDLGIHLHEFQPIPSLRSSFKKSSTQPNCLAVNTTHVFTAQADKSVIHVYSRGRGNQEAVVPFQEKITCLVLAGPYHGAGTLVLGTEGGRLILLELATGRQITTPQSHLQPVTCLAVDPTSNFLVSGSADSNIHLWSLPSLLSFSQPAHNDPSQPRQYSPLRTLSDHRAAITAVIFGHSASKANFAISAANDKTCLIWDYFTGTVLHTYLLSFNPLCLTLDPADRAAYAGYEDGSIQILDFYKQQSSLVHPHYDADYQSTPTQPPDSDRWSSSEIASSPVHCLQLNYDGTILLTSHENGKVHTWNIAKGKYNNQLADLTLPVTNLVMLPPTGFPVQNSAPVKLQNVVKPRYENSWGGAAVNNGTSAVPITHTYTVQFTSTIPLPDPPAGYSDFDEALTHPSFPQHMLDEGIAELESLAKPHTEHCAEIGTRKRAGSSALGHCRGVGVGEREVPEGGG
ncbi:MAG: hypothetical protein LQ352_001015 [Teloschistes flavicans]|nr:MAG: hypothetical protein LQ352_001015 [Teloschistes flavicans]